MDEDGWGSTKRRWHSQNKDKRNDCEVGGEKRLLLSWTNAEKGVE